MNRRRFLGWCLVWASLPLFSIAVGALFGLTVVGAANLAGMGDEVTVVITEDPEGPGDGRSGNGYYVFDGERVPVTVDGVEKGERRKATLSVTTGLGEPGAYAYVDGSRALDHIVFGLILTAVGWPGGWVLYRLGRKLAPEKAGKSRARTG